MYTLTLVETILYTQISGVFSDQLVCPSVSPDVYLDVLNKLVSGAYLSNPPNFTGVHLNQAKCQVLEPCSTSKVKLTLGV